MEEFDYYVLEMMGCVDPVLHGPYDTEAEQQNELTGFLVYEDQNSFVPFYVTKGSVVKF